MSTKQECPVCHREVDMKLFPTWLETCPYCGNKLDGTKKEYQTTKRREALRVKDYGNI